MRNLDPARRPGYSGNYPMAQRQALLDAEGVTLNGERAKVVGRRLDFAVVAALGGSGARAEYAWQTVEHVIATRGGAFTT